MPATPFAFDVNASTAKPFKSAKHRSFGQKALFFDSDGDLDDISLAERRRRKRCRFTETVRSDDVDFCLAGSSVVDPLLHLEDLPPLPSSPTLPTSEVALEVPSVPPSEEVTIGVLADGYTPWASAQRHSSPLPSTTDQKALNANVNNRYSLTVESESPPGSSPQSVNNNNNNSISAESEISPVSSLALVPYHDPDSHDNSQDILWSDTPPASSSLTTGPSNLEPISPAPPSVETGAVIDANV